jgi:serine/threonine-protein kinase
VASVETIALGASARTESAAAQEQYVIGPYLNQGGMATVFLGKHIGRTGIATPIVLKRLRSELTHVPELRALLFSEAELQSRLLHPCIVRTTDLVVIDGEYYLVMEYVRGGDLLLLLRRARRRGQRFSAAAALFIVRELLQALGYAHELRDARGVPLGVIHRDISPANILISGDGEVKLSDFGIAQTSQVEELGLRLRGKVGYMSPEQARQEELDQRSDLFSLGTVLYELLTAKRLFVGQEGESASRVYAAPILPPSTLCPSLPPAADAVILRALQLDKNDRPRSALKWYEELLLLSQRHGLWMDRSELGAHLRVMLGDDPESWRMVEERSGTARIPSFLEADELWEEPSSSIPSESMMAISVARTLEFAAPRSSEVSALHADVTAPVPKQSDPVVISAAPQAPTQIIVAAMPSGLRSYLRKPLLPVLVFSILSLLSAALVWLLLR